MKSLFYLLSLSCFINFSCDGNNPQKFVNDPVDAGKIRVIAKGDFVSMASDHNISGKALFISENSNKLLRLENFSVLNGPAVHVYLSKTSDYEDVIDLGELKGTNGNINYDFNDSVNTDEYHYALVWCRKYKVNFGYAELIK